MSCVVAYRGLTSLSQATLFLVHEAARQLVAARLKSHLGGPTHTLAALDQAVQKLAAEAASSKGGQLAPVFCWGVAPSMHARVCTWWDAESTGGLRPSERALSYAILQ